MRTTITRMLELKEQRHYSEPETIELAWTISAYIMLGKLIHAFRIPHGDEVVGERAVRPE
jgi:hypothetical protein